MKSIGVASPVLAICLSFTLIALLNWNDIKAFQQQARSSTNPVKQQMANSTTDSKHQHNMKPVAVVPKIKNSTMAPKSPGKFYYRAEASLMKDGNNATVFGGVEARAFPHKAVTCLPPESKWDTYGTQMTPTNEGLFFLKTFKTGSSTASGIDLRIARNVAKRRNTGHALCRTRFDHAWASALFYSLNPQTSFLWTVLRDPTSRIVSQLFHFHVSREGHNTSDASLMERIRRNDGMTGNNYMGQLSLRGFKKKHDDPVAVANAILNSYDFIAITERMDESAVALSMIMGIPLADVLYLKAKGHGGYDAGGDGHDCTYITPAFVSPGMEQFFRSDEYQDMVQWDYLLYRAANKSLDLTIDALGREEFERKLALFRQAQERAIERCLPTVRFPCSPKGKSNSETDCLWKDSGCGYMCLDEVATELGLWNY